MKKKKRTKSRARNPRGGERAPRIQTFEITEDPVVDETIAALPAERRERATALVQELHEVVMQDPVAAIPRLEQTIQEFPTVAPFGNYLLTALVKTKQFESAEELALENYRRHPNYLFAKLNLAEVFYQRGQLDRVPELFGGIFDLKRLYPRRNVFHITEVVSFFGLVGAYWARMENPGVARAYLQILEDLAPDHPITRRLSALCNPSLLDCLLRRIRGPR